MINAIIGAISIALDTEFGDGCKKYMEEKKQDLEEPCFFIQCLNPTDTLFIGRKYFRQNQFCIQYFPESEHGKNQECYKVAERLDNCLEYISLDVLIRGTQRKSRVIDGVLHYFVNYDCFVCRREEVPVMSELVSQTRLKEGDGRNE